MIKNSEIPVVILSGGFGTRLEKLTKSLPKPLIKIGKDPILLHVMRIYLHQGYRNFFLAGGYKIKKLFNFFKIKNNNKKNYMLDNIQCSVQIINTGRNSMTGSRIKVISRYFKDNVFMATYGDGLCNINLNKLLKYHFKKKKLITITAVNPPPRFGQIVFKGSVVKKFSEKNKIKNVWINGGFFIISKKFLKYIKGHYSILEREPFEKAVKIGQMSAFRHNGFWACMDTRRDRDKLLNYLKKKPYPWLKN